MPAPVSTPTPWPWEKRAVTQGAYMLQPLPHTPILLSHWHRAAAVACKVSTAPRECEILMMLFCLGNNCPAQPSPVVLTTTASHAGVVLGTTSLLQTMCWKHFLSLETFQVRLNLALSNLTYSKMSLLTTERLV